MTLWVGQAIALFSAVLVWLSATGSPTGGIWSFAGSSSTSRRARSHWTYGVFYAVWKIWHAHLKADGAAAGIDKELRQSLLDRFMAEEGRYNAPVVKLVFREGQRCLRGAALFAARGCPFLLPHR